MRDGFYSLIINEAPYSFQIEGGQLLILKPDGTQNNTGEYHRCARITFPCGLSLDDSQIVAAIEMMDGI